jgi:hypothetical protein
MALLNDIRTWRFWRHFLTWTFACLGLLSTLLQTINIIYPDFKGLQGTPILIVALLGSITVGLMYSWPRPIAQNYSAPKMRIAIVEGNILDEECHLVIGTNDTFDTQTPVIIAKSSLQGQMLESLYGGDVDELDRQISLALAAHAPISTVPKAGKQQRYGTGTVATLKHGPRLLFLLAYCELDEKNVARSSPNTIWSSLQALWKEVANRANGGAIAIPAVGGGQARVSNLMPAQDAIRLIVLSFMFASRAEKLCDELRIVVRPSDFKTLDRLELQSFLSSLRSS